MRPTFPLIAGVLAVALAGKADAQQSNIRIDVDDLWLAEGTNKVRHEPSGEQHTVDIPIDSFFDASVRNNGEVVARTRYYLFGPLADEFTTGAVEFPPEPTGSPAASEWFSWPPEFPSGPLMPDLSFDFQSIRTNNGLYFGASAGPVGQASLPQAASPAGEPVPSWNASGMPQVYMPLLRPTEDSDDVVVTIDNYTYGQESGLEHGGTVVTLNTPPDTTGAWIDWSPTGLTFNASGSIFGFAQFDIGGEFPTIEEQIIRIDEDQNDVTTLAGVPAGRTVRSNVATTKVGQTIFWIENSFFAPGAPTLQAMDLFADDGEPVREQSLPIDLGGRELRGDAFLRQMNRDLLSGVPDLGPNDQLIAGLFETQGDTLADQRLDLLFVVNPVVSDDPMSLSLEAQADATADGGLRILDRVPLLGIGDEVFGRTITSFDLGPVPLSPSGRVAVTVETDDGASGVLTFQLSAARIPGDFDLDGDVDAFDLGIWQTGFGITGGATAMDGDADADGDVDAFDLGLWQTNFGTGVGATVPEPATVVLSAVMSGAVFARPVRRKTLRRLA